MPAKKSVDSSAPVAAQPEDVAMASSAASTVRSIPTHFRGDFDVSKLHVNGRAVVTYDGQRPVKLVLGHTRDSWLDVSQGLRLDGKLEKPVFLVSRDEGGRGQCLSLRIAADQGLQTFVKQLEEKAKTFVTHEWISLLSEDGVLRVAVCLGECADRLTELEVSNAQGKKTIAQGWEQAEAVLRETDGLDGFEIRAVVELKAYKITPDAGSADRPKAGLRMVARLLQARAVIEQDDDVLDRLE